MTVQETIREAEATLERLRARLVAARKELSAIYARQEAIAYEVATGNFEAKALSAIFVSRRPGCQKRSPES